MLADDRPTTSEASTAFAATPSLQQEWEFRGSPNGIASISLAIGWRLVGPLDIAALQRVLDEIVRRHEALRTCIAEQEGSVMQVVLPHLRIPVEFVDLRHIRPKKRWRTLVRRTNAALRSPFSLARLPLVRPTLFRVGRAEHVFELVLAHTIWDAGSMDVFVAEFTALYSAFANALPSPLPELAAQYADAAEWDRRRGTSEADGSRPRAPVDWSLALPTSREPRAASGHRPAVEPIPLIAPWVPNRLDSVAHACGTIPVASVLAVVSLLLHGASGQSDLVFGFHRTGRDAAETRSLIGYFAENLLVGVDLSGTPTFRQLVTRAGSELADLYGSAQTMSATFPEEERKGPWDGKATCDVILNYLAVDWTRAREQHALPFTLLPFQPPNWFNLFPVATLWDFGLLDFSIQRHGANGGMDGRLGFNSGAIERDFAQALVRGLGRLMRLAALHPDRTVQWLIGRARAWEASLPTDAFNWPRLHPGVADRLS